jgi:hypothetical protein
MNAISRAALAAAAQPRPAAPAVPMGLMALIGALVVGIVVAVDQSNCWLHASGQVANSPMTPVRA